MTKRSCRPGFGAYGDGISVWPQEIGYMRGQRHLIVTICMGKLNLHDG